MNDPVPASSGMPYVSRGRRRRWVLAMYVCVAAVALWLALGDDHWSAWLAVAPMVAAATLYFKLVVPIRYSLTEKEDGELDERQLAVRNRAYFYAFRILGLVVRGVGGPGRQRRGPSPTSGPWASSSRSCSAPCRPRWRPGWSQIWTSTNNGRPAPAVRRV